MNGGTITNCKSTDSGGGVYVNGGAGTTPATFVMNAGTISNCTSKQGGAVYVNGTAGDRSQSGTFKMYGGTLVGNKATTTYTSTTGSMSATGNQGDAVYVNGNFYIHGSIEIEGTVYLHNTQTSNYMYILVDGPLSVVGNQGYIDVFTEYTYNGFENVGGTVAGYGSAYTVVENVSSDVDDVTFCGYAAYFYNSAAGMNVAAGKSGGINTTAQNYYTSYQDAAGSTWYVANDNQSEMALRTGKFLIYVGRNSQHTDASYNYALKLTKYGENSAVLQGAVFTVYSDADHTQAVGTITTGSGGVGYLMTSGSSTHSRLSTGTYYLVETTAPADYTALLGDVVITITNPVTSENTPGYSLTLPSGYELGGTDGLEDPNANFRTLVLTAKDSKEAAVKVTLNVTKTGSDGTTVLSGASFGLYKAEAGATEVTYDTSAKITNAQVGSTQTTGTDGKVSFSDVEPGTYILKETNAPAGYSLAPGIVVTVASDGTVSASQTVSGTPKTIDVTNSNLTASFTVTDNPLATLPSTGGGGMAECVLTGTTLAMLAGSALVCVRRRRPRAIGGAAPGKNGSG